MDRKEKQAKEKANEKSKAKREQRAGGQQQEKDKKVRTVKNILMQKRFVFFLVFAILSHLPIAFLTSLTRPSISF